MYIFNQSILKSPRVECGKTIFEYLSGRSVPLLSFDMLKQKYYFVHTELVEELLNQIPLDVKIKRYFSGEEDYKII